MGTSAELLPVATEYVFGWWSEVGATMGVDTLISIHTRAGLPVVTDAGLVE